MCSRTQEYKRLSLQRGPHEQVFCDKLRHFLKRSNLNGRIPTIDWLILKIAAFVVILAAKRRLSSDTCGCPLRIHVSSKTIQKYFMHNRPQKYINDWGWVSVFMYYHCKFFMRISTQDYCLRIFIAFHASQIGFNVAFI